MFQAIIVSFPSQNMELNIYTCSFTLYPVTTLNGDKRMQNVYTYLKLHTKQ